MIWLHCYRQHICRYTRSPLLPLDPIKLYRKRTQVYGHEKRPYTFRIEQWWNGKVVRSVNSGEIDIWQKTTTERTSTPAAGLTDTDLWQTIYTWLKPKLIIFNFCIVHCLNWRISRQNNCNFFFGSIWFFASSPHAAEYAIYFRFQNVGFGRHIFP